MTDGIARRIDFRLESEFLASIIRSTSESIDRVLCLYATFAVVVSLTQTRQATLGSATHALETPPSPATYSTDHLFLQLSEPV